MDEQLDIVVIDGQGGGVGKSIIEAIKNKYPHRYVVGVGTNAVATNSLKKGGADAIATGENAIIYCASRAKNIIGPIGICFTNSMLGEISPSIVKAVQDSSANKYLIPMNKCPINIVGIENKTINEYIQELLTMI